MRFSSIALVLVGSLTAVGMIGCTEKSATTQSAPLAAPVPTIDTTKPTIVTIKSKPVATTQSAPLAAPVPTKPTIVTIKPR
jgi:hypothetical protein